MKKVAAVCALWVLIQVGVLAWYAHDGKRARGDSVRLVPVSDEEVRRYAALPDWKRCAVRQRRPQTGCIPTGYEFLLRAVGIEGVKYETFQEDFDSGDRPADFESVATAVRAKYSHIHLSVRRFKRGAEKLRFVEERLSRRQPILIALTLYPDGVWHIMPVIGSNRENLILLWVVRSDGFTDVRALRKEEFIRIHEEWPGGDDVAFIDLLKR